LYNLIGNAVKFTHEGKITVSAKEEKNKIIRIFIADTGIGIPKNKREKIFKFFTQAYDSDAWKYGGTGLGLAVSKRLVEMHGCEIVLESCGDSGTVFSFTLPVADILNSSNLTEIQ